MRQALGVSECRACRTLGQHRSTQRKVPCGLPDEEQLTDDIIELARESGRYGSRMITGNLSKSWGVAQYLNGRTRRKTLGKHDGVTADEARRGSGLLQAGEKPDDQRA